MKKLIALVFALFVAMTSAAETYVASTKIEQEVLAGSLIQEVYAGDSIKLIKIKYDNIDESKHQSGNISDLGLTEKWTGSVCEISGKINGNIAAQTIKAYILVQDDEGKYAKTNLSFKVLEKPFKFELNDGYGRMNQTVKIGYSITPIIFEYDAIEEWGVSGLPSGLISEIDEKMHYIIVAGTVEESVESGDYEYKVTVKDYNSEEHTLSGTITVKGLTDVTSIKVIENEKQKVTAGNAIKPVVFKFEYAQDIEIKDIPPGHFGGASEEGTFVVEGTVAENAKDGNYTIKVIAKGEQNNDTAFATVEVTHKPVVTSLSVIENETQTVTAGDSIEPIVFKFENVVDIDGLTGFPGGYMVVPDNATKTIFVIGLINEKAEGPYTVKLAVKGADNDASAEATINVIRSLSSSSITSSSSAVASSSSEAASSSSTESSSSAESSSSEAPTKIATVAMNGVKFGYTNNVLTVASPTSSMVRVQVFDLTGHLVETLAEPVMGSRSFSLVHLNRGNYLVRIENGSQSRTAKIAVK